jgi:predicted nucleic-acid-binding Zn-ribbon protein
MNESSLIFVDPMEVCPKCGAKAMHLMDNLSLYAPECYVTDDVIGSNFDNAIYAESICDECGYIEHVMDKISWVVPNVEKRKKYVEMYKNGIDPVTVNKFNL